jgi:putative ubiquitin-RnfH superfamily antitoxin RatB of RatAB toxin-antitoxin module
MAEVLIDVEVAYATPGQQVIVELKMPQNATIEQAIAASGLLARFPEITATAVNAGIFGEIRKPDQGLRQGDRVEIYRPLPRDPKEARRQRAAKG